MFLWPDSATLTGMEFLVPDAPFAVMPQFMLLVVAGGAIYFLIQGADWLVDGAAGLAYRFGMPQVIVGATIVSLGTTSPEAAVSVMAAWQNMPGLALGNAVGSIIADTGLIFGLGCILVVLPADKFVLSRQGWVKVGSCVLLAVLCYLMLILEGEKASLGRTIGIVLLVLLVGYMAISVVWSRAHPQGEPFVAEESMEADLAIAAPEPAEAHKSVLILLALIVGGLALVVLSSRFVIASVSQLATRWGVPEVVIASTIVALGTSLPELVVGMTALIRGHRGLLVGNVIGADILNVLFVVGASAVAAPLPIVDTKANFPYIFFYLHIPTMLIMVGLFLGYILISARRGEFRKWYGYPLLGLYVAFLAIGWLLEAG